jgi:phage tail-like protein
MRKGYRLLLAACLVVLLALTTGAASSRSYVSGNYMLTLDGVNIGFVKSVSGGGVYAEVVNEAAGPDYFVRKHIGQPKYEDFAMQIGFSMTKEVYDWIAASWKMNYQRKNGEVIATDYNQKATSTRQFTNALLTEVTMPALDGASKEPAYMTVKFAPESIRTTKASPDSKSTAAAASPKGEQKTWIPANFRLEIDGLDATKVSKVDAFTVKQSAVQDGVGEARDAQREPGKLEFPNLKITLSEAGADTWYQWQEDFVIKGNNDQTKEKNGTIYYLATDRQTVLAKVKLYNVGIIHIAEEASESGSDAIQRATAELYVERMEFEGPGDKK